MRRAVRKAADHDERRFGRSGRVHSGLGQLSLVEHALCPLDRKASLHSDRFNETSYRYTDSSGKRRTASVRVSYPLGLTASDEFYLWGLLALTMSQPERSNELHASPHYFLKQLGVLKTKGGRNYEMFRQAIRRLAGVSYQNDGFYDPVRAEHREVGFNFLSYSLPLDPNSCRAWRLVWNPIFFEMCAATGSTLSFDLALYRELDEASRRLFLLLKKVFWRRKDSPRFDVRELATHVLGFSADLPQRRLNERLRRCIKELIGREIISKDCEVQKKAKGVYSIRFHRGAYFAQAAKRSKTLTASDSPLIEPLTSLGFDSATVGRILADYSHAVIREWVDITLAAAERFGDGFFKVSRQAYLMDNLKHVSTGTRAAPDWWHVIRKEEDRRMQEQHRAARKPRPVELDVEQQATFDRIAEELFQQFRSAGQSEMAALNNAKKMARQHVLNQSRSASSKLRALKPES